MNHKKRYGVSYACVCNQKEEKMMLYADLCIEFPCDKMGEIRHWLQIHDGEFSLHYPSVHSVQQVGFCLCDKAKRKKVFEDFKKYIRAFPKAEYFLFHFPGLDQNQTWEEIEEIFREFSDYFGQYASKIVIENMSDVSCCCSASDYKKLLEYTEFGICLDVGHAHLISNEELYDFIELLKERIRVVHFYNTTNNLKNSFYGKHLPSNYQIEEGIQLEKVKKLISEIKHELFIIDESKENYGE